MSDRYQSFANSALGQLVAKNLGLPMPLNLERFDASKPVVDGKVLLGAAANGTLCSSIAKVLASCNANVVASDTVIASIGDSGLQAQAYVADESASYKAFVFDASGITSSEQLVALHQFFSPIARQLSNCGRVVILGLAPESLKDTKHATAQRALEGFIKAVGKEFKKACAANVIYVKDGGADNIAAALRFFVSPRCAYVSGQVVRVGKATAVDVDWSKPLAGKTALVTGASRGIGEAIAHVLARDGAHVICLDIPPQEADLNRVAGQIGGSILCEDITDADAPQRILEAGLAKGGLDIIVHNAGVTRDKTLAKMTDAMWNLVMNINLTSEERINDYLLANKGINKNGRIVCVSSISGIAGNLGQTNYAASKAGVIGMVQAIAPTLKTGITINAVAPGFIETQMTAAIPLTIREAGRRMNSMSQGGQPQDVAEAIALFASNGAGALNGNIVRVCGQSLIGA